MSAAGAEKRMSLFEQLRLALPEQLPVYLAHQRWFGGKGRRIRSAQPVDLIPLRTGELEAFVLLVRVEYEIGAGETYVLPVVSACASAAEAKVGEAFLAVPAFGPNDEAILTDALKNEKFLLWLLDAVEVRLISHGAQGDIRADYTDVFQDIRSKSSGALQPRLIQAEQSNSSIVYADALILKLFRRLEEGINPDLEIGLFLTEKSRFRNVPPVAGSIEYQSQDGTLSSLAVLQAFIPNRGDAWRFSTEWLAAFWDEVAKLPDAVAPRISMPGANALELDRDIPRPVADLIAPYLDKIGLLGTRTAELHLALASDSSDPAFTPEPYTPSFHRDFEQSARELTGRVFGLLRQKRAELSDELRAQAEAIINAQPRVLRTFESAANVHGGMRTRIHGDYHLGQVLYTGSDFVIIDFEGEPARPLAERLIKRSPLQDVAGMIRSFHYAAFAQLLAAIGDSSSSKSDLRRFSPWAESWYSWVTSRFLRSYFQMAHSGSFLPPNREEVSTLLRIHLLEKAVYELGYELNNRPSWVAIPLVGVSMLLAQ